MKSAFTLRNGTRYVEDHLELLQYVNEQGGQGRTSFVYNTSVGRTETLKEYKSKGIREHEMSALRDIEQKHYPRIPMIYDIGEAEGVPWMTMSQGKGLGTHEKGYSRLDFEQGKLLTLSQLIYGPAAGTPAPQREAIEALMRAPWRQKLGIIIEAMRFCSVLHESYGIVVNDIKPEHLLLLANPAGQQEKRQKRQEATHTRHDIGYLVQFIDFGLHIRLHELERTGAFILSPGTLPYSSPEALKTFIHRGRTTTAGDADDGPSSLHDPAALALRDNWSLGITAMQLLATHPYIHEARERIHDSPILRRLEERRAKACLDPEIHDDIEREQAKCYLRAQESFLSRAATGAFSLRAFNPELPRSVEKTLLHLLLQSSATGHPGESEGNSRERSQMEPWEDVSRMMRDDGGES